MFLWIQSVKLNVYFIFNQKILNGIKILIFKSFLAKIGSDNNVKELHHKADYRK